MNHRARFWIKAVFLLLAAAGTAWLPARAWAVQVHGPPEGLYAHQMAHIFFAAALLFFLYILRYRPLGSGPAWRYFRYALVFFLLWNVDTCVVHWLAHRLPDEAITASGPIWRHALNPPLTAGRWLYYLGRFDHLLSVPAVFFLVLSLRAFCRSVEGARLRGK